MGAPIHLGARRAWLGGSLVRAVVLATAAAALLLVALPPRASADPRVRPPACPPDVTLQDVERFPGGSIFSGTVTSVTPEVGRVRLRVETWYHRSMVPGLAAGEHPGTVDVMLGPEPGAAGRAAPTTMPEVGSRLLVAGSWIRPIRGVGVGCGIAADLGTPAGAAWLAAAEAHYAPVTPSVDTGPPQVPLDAPWFLVGLGAALMVLAAMILGAVAQARDPAPAV